MAELAVYAGPQCPHCNETLLPQWLRDGTIDCPMCSGTFDATAFQPPVREIQAVEHAGARPDDDTACANHERNAAITSCRRCGLFICALCDMNIGAGSYCPNCFERVRNEGTLESAARRYRDYTAMGSISLAAGLFLWFAMPLFGAVGIYFAVKGFKQRRELGRSRVGPVIVLLIGLAELVGTFAIIALIVYSASKTP